jgi:hypothetical protein
LAHRGTFRGKYASVMVPYATRGWIPYVMLQPNVFFGILGLKVIHRAAFNVQGLGEAVQDGEAIEKAHRIGKELARAVLDQDPTYRSEPGLCPICQDWTVRILKDRKAVECPTCGIRGELKVKDGTIEVVFDERAMAEYRFHPEVGYNHFTYHIKPSRDYFLRTKEDRKAKRIDNRTLSDGMLREETLDKAIEEITQDVITVSSEDEGRFRKAIVAIYQKYRSPRTPYSFWGSSQDGERIAKAVADATGGGW